MARISLEEHVLGNGLRVVLAPDAISPVVAVCVVYRVGSGHEGPGRTGFAHLFEHMMFQGSTHVAKGEHFALVHAAGGRANAYTGWDSTVYYETLPAHRLELALWLEADRMAGLLDALTEATLDNQREVVKNERRSKVDNQPYGSWEERLFALAYPAHHPYHHSAFGLMEDLSAASAEDVAGFFTTWYVPNNAVLVIAGGFDPSEALEMTDRHFGPIRAGALPAQPGPPPTRAPSGSRRVDVAGAVPAARIFVGFRVPPFGSDAFDALEVLADILATGRGSRLYAELVRRRGAAQEASATAIRLAAGEALFVIDVSGREGVSAGELEKACDVVIATMRRNGPRRTDVERVRALRRAAWACSLERAAERADLIGLHAAVLGRADGVNRELERYLAVGPGAVRSAASAHLAPRNRSVVAFSPA